MSFNTRIWTMTINSSLTYRWKKYLNHTATAPFFQPQYLYSKARSTVDMLCIVHDIFNKGTNIFSWIVIFSYKIIYPWKWKEIMKFEIRYNKMWNAKTDKVYIVLNFFLFKNFSNNSILILELKILGINILASLNPSEK